MLNHILESNKLAVETFFILKSHWFVVASFDMKSPAKGKYYFYIFLQQTCRAPRPYENSRMTSDVCNLTAH